MSTQDGKKAVASEAALYFMFYIPKIDVFFSLYSRSCRDILARGAGVCMYFYKRESEFGHHCSFLFPRQPRLCRPANVLVPSSMYMLSKQAPSLFTPGLLLLASILPLSVDEDPNTSAPTTSANVPVNSPLVPAERSFQDDCVQPNPAKTHFQSPAACSSSARCSVHACREKNQQKLQQTFLQSILVPC